MIEGIDHVNLVVRDLDRMKTFYRDVLGFRVTKEVTISGEWISHVVGLSDVVADVVYLDPCGGPRVELICYRHPEGTISEWLSRANTMGIRHIAFRVSAIDNVVAALERSGVKTRSPVATVPQTQVSYGGGAQKKLAYFEDPEGNLLEICEYS
jgi:catechol 2,3-dioxygenase-like lactoylglutathione lyase family enzyme